MKQTQDRKVRFPKDHLGQAAKEAFLEWRAGLSNKQRNRLYDGSGHKHWRKKKTAPGRTSGSGSADGQSAVCARQKPYTKPEQNTNKH